MKRNIINGISSIFLILFLAGCINKAATDNQFKKVVEEKLILNDEIKNDFKENMQRERRYVDFIIPKNIQLVLNQLGEIDGRAYVIDNIEDLFEFPVMSRKVKIRSFKELQKLVETLTDYKIKITKNKYGKKNSPKIVYIKNNTKELFKSKKFFLKNNDSKISLDDIIVKLMKNTGYNVIYVQNYYNQLDSNNTQNEDKSFFKGKKIYYTGDNYYELLNVISQNFNLYLDFNKRKNLVVFSKYKQINYKLLPKNEVIKSDFKVGEGSSSTEGKATNIEIDLYGNFEKTLNKIINGRDTQDTKNSKHGWVKVENNGDVVGLVTKDTAKEIAIRVNKFNKEYSQIIEATITIYDYALNKNMNIGSDFSYVSDKITATTNLLKGSFLSYEDKSRKLKSAVVNSLNEIGHKLKINSYTYKLKNHIPKYKRSMIDGEYFSKTDTQQIGEQDGTILFKTTPQIEKLKEGTEFVVSASSQGGLINVEMQAWIQANISIEEKKQGEDTVSLAKNSNDTFVHTLPMEDGDIALVDKMTILDSSKKYEGVIPIEDFIIGGNTDDKYIRRINVITIGTKRVRSY